MRWIDLYELKIGDIFRESNRPAKYEMLRLEYDDVNLCKVVIGKETHTGEEVRFSYTVQMYGPNIILLQSEGSFARQLVNRWKENDGR